MTKRATPAQKRTVNIHEAKTQFSKLVELAEAGHEIIISRAGKPVARLVQLAEEKPKIRFGVAKGKFTMSDDFNDPLPDDLLALFEGR